MPIPNQWTKSISNPTNKANLTNFLCERWSAICPEVLPDCKSILLTGGSHDPMKYVKLYFGLVDEIYELYSDQEEADTRIMLHARHALMTLIG